MKKIINVKSFTAIFVSGFLLVVSLGSFCKLMNHYINNTEVNNNTAQSGTPFETDVVSNLFGRMWFVNINGLFRRITIQPEMNNVIKLKNGHLAQVCPKADNEKTDFKVSEIAKFDSLCKEKGIDFLYVIPPYEISKYDNELPVGFEDYTNENIDYFRERLCEAGVENIDIGEMIHNDNLNVNDFFYITDGHWNSDAAFYTFTKIADYFKENKGYSFDERVLDRNEYDLKTFPDAHLGGQGQRTGKYYAGVDDFSVYVPKFETRFWNLVVDREDATFEEAAYNFSYADSRDLMERDLYATVFAPARSHFVNYTTGNGKWVMVLSDSFGKALMPFMMLGFEEGGWMDTGLLTEEFLDENTPDVIIMTFHNTHLNDDKEPWMINMVY